jgi:anti-sigma factor RsiW
MSHLNELDLIKLAGGRLGANERLAAETHVGACSECQARLASARQTWRALGVWDVTAGGDMAARVVEAAGRQAQLPPVPAWWRAAQPALRAAAAILLAAGTGHVAGRWASPRLSSSPAAVTATAEEAACEAMSLDVLAYQSAAGLAEALLDLDAPAEEVQR